MKKFIIPFAVITIIVFILILSSGGGERSYKERTQTFDDRAQKYTELGFEFKKENRFEDAERAFLKAIELDPVHEKQAYLGLAEIYQFALKEKDHETPEIFMKGLLHDPKDIILLRALAQYFERVENFSQSRYWYGKITEYYPNDAPAKQKLQQVGY
jgi:tetratricopeptide (TPR) repeat protein